MAIRSKYLCDMRGKAGTPLWETDLGHRTRALEKQLMAPALGRLLGESVLWVGEDPQSADVLARGMIKLPMFLNPVHTCADQAATGPHAQLASFQALLESLPFQSRSLDGVVLHHCLESVSDPRVALREIARVMAPGARLVIAGYNPWSLLGLRRVYARVLPDFLQARKLVNPIRLFDWLTLLGLELAAAPIYGGNGLLRNTFNGNSQSKGPSQLPFGGIIVISAIKRAHNMQYRFAKPRAPRTLAPVTYPRIASWERVASTREDPRR